ncbi:MAG: peptidylprolyl isomerase [Planctomycetota bacterium]|nr:peptidylprolyl isomerase [Planctomycetota bacterium]
MVLLCCLMLSAIALSAEVDEQDKPLIAVPDFMLKPADKFDDKDMGVLATSMVSKVLEQKFEILERSKLLKWLEENGIAQKQLFTDGEAIKKIAELGCTALVSGVITKRADGYELRLSYMDLQSGKSVVTEPSLLKETGDFTNSCRELARQLLDKLEPERTPEPTTTPANTPNVEDKGLLPQEAIEKLERTSLTFETSKGSFTMRLFPREAPYTCRNFVNKCSGGFYDNMPFHRVIPGRIVQAGKSDRPVVEIPNEFNDHPHVAGTVSMARNPYTKDYSHGSQFFISVDRLGKLDRNFTVFGHVVEGMETVLELNNVPVHEEREKRYQPVEEVLIKTVKVTETDAEFDAPKMLPPMFTLQDAEGLYARIETDRGVIKMRFFPSKAPKLVANFIDLAQRHFYDGLIWHRVIPGFVIQTGDPAPNNPSVNNAPIDSVRQLPSDLKHVRGAVAMAKRADTPRGIHSTSQFYICLDDLPKLDGEYAVFGQVFEGMEVADAISEVQTDPRDMPLKPVRIIRMDIRKIEGHKPWKDEAGGMELVPAEPNTPHKDIVAVIDTDMGEIWLDFYPDKAPLTVANFMKLARRGFYDGMYVHRVSTGQIIQMGNPETNGQKQVDTIKDEDSGLAHYEGTVAMAKKSAPHTATSQFFVNLRDNMQYNENYTVFARVIKGMEVAKKIGSMRVTDMKGTPEKKVYFTIRLMRKR